MSEDDWPLPAYKGGGLLSVYDEKRSFRKRTPEQVEADRQRELIEDVAYPEACALMRAKYGARIIREPCAARWRWTYSFPAYELHNERLKPWENELFETWADLVASRLGIVRAARRPALQNEPWRTFAPLPGEMIAEPPKPAAARFQRSRRSGASVL